MTRYVRLTKVAQVEIEENESTTDAVERANILDSEAVLFFELYTDIVDEDGKVLEEI
jgi:hypothetical protein